MSDNQGALDRIDHFIEVAGNIATTRLLLAPEIKKPIAEGLYQICKKLQVANQNLARWQIKFLLFNFGEPNAIGEFLSLVQEYKIMKTGPEFHQLKYRSGDIGIIYSTIIEPKITQLFRGDLTALDEARQSFTELGDSDKNMVDFIHDIVIGKIDAYVNDVLPISATNLNAAERRQLVFIAESAGPSERLVKFSGGLAELVLRFAEIAERPVEP